MDTEGLSIICAGLGLAEEDDNGNLTGYMKSEYCLDNLKDLQRFLRRDDPQRRDVFKQICKWNTVSRDLIPILEQYQSDRNLVINAVKILVFLTMPIDHTSDDITQQMEYLWDLKAALTRNITIAVVVELLEDPLDHLGHDAFTEDDWKLVQLVLTLFRNILAIQEISLQQKAVGSATRFLCLRDRFIEFMFQENVMDLILVLTQHIDGSSGYLRQDNLLLLEIFHFIFLGQDPELIAKTSVKGSKVDGGVITSVDSLRSMMEEEEKRRIIRLRNMEQHSQFSGTFTRLAMDGSKTFFKGNPAAASGDGVLKVHKVQRGPLKRIAWDHESTSLPKENILELLYNFLDQLLTGGYNVLMQSIHDDIKKEHQAIQNSDVILFFQVADFVIAFQHKKVSSAKKPNTEGTTPEASLDNGLDDLSFHGDFCGPIAATMNDSMFCLVISRWREAFDGLKETKDHKFQSAAVSLMKNMIRMLDLVLKLLPEDSKEHQTARILLYKIFYDQTDQGLTQFLLNLFKLFDNHKQPKCDLADLLEIIHIVLRLMEKLQARGTLRVSKKSRKGRKKKKAKDEIKVAAERQGEEHCGLRNADSLTHETGMPTESILNPNEAIKEHLYESSSADKEHTSISYPLPVEKAVHLRDGSSHVDSDKVSNHLSPAVESAMPPQDTMQLRDDSSHMDNDKINNNLIDLAYETADSSDDDPPPPVNEVNFNVSKLVASFASNAVIQNLCWLLKYYRGNSATTNHYIIFMLQRFCDDLELSPLLYQLSVLATFYDILADQKSSKEYANIVYFLTKFIRKMLKIIKKQPLLFVEILFWKTRKECHYINADALIGDLVKMKKDIRSWDSEGANLPNDKGGPGTGPKGIADSLGDDEADFVTPHDLSHHGHGEENVSDGAHQKYSHRTKESVSNRKSMASFINNEIDEDTSGGISSDVQTQKASKRQKSPIFDQEQETAIKNLYEKYKDDRQCSRLIAKTLDPDGKISPLQVSCKLRQLGLKVVSRRRVVSADVPLPVGDDSTGIEENTFASSGVPSSSKEAENLFPTTSSHKRKRIQAFSKEQELEVKNLFERFKNNKKCSYMIANSLDSDNTYTAAQISRKLMELGLLVPPKRRSSKDAKHSGEKVIDRTEQNVEETLLAIKERNKRKKSKTSVEAVMASISQHEETSRGDHDSDDEILSTMIKNKRKKSKLSTKEAAMPSIPQHEATLAEDHDSDEILSSMLRNAATLQESTPSPPGGLRAVDSTALDDDMEAEMDSSNVVEDGGVAVFSNEDARKELGTREEVDDSGDDMGPVVPRKTGTRRNLKMIIDVEDDE